MEFRAVRKCQYGNKIYREGERLSFSGDIAPCPTCEGTGKLKGLVCGKCKGTARFNPPHHFMPVDPVAEQKQVEEKIKDEAAQIEEVRAEFTAMGAAFDRRWRLPKLKAELIEAKKERGL